MKDLLADRFDSLEVKIYQLTTDVKSMKEKGYSYSSIPKHQDNHIKEEDRKEDTKEDIGNIPDFLSPKLQQMLLRNLRVPG